MLGGCLSLALLAALPVYMEVAKPGVSRTRKENTRIRTIIRGLFQGFANMKPPICHSSICVHRSRFVHVIRLSGNEIPSTSLFWSFAAITHRHNRLIYKATTYTEDPAESGLSAYIFF